MTKELPKILGKYKLNYNIAHLTWFKVGGNAEILFKPKDAYDLINFLKQNAQNSENKLPITVIGAGSNLIVRDGGIDGFVVKLGAGFTEININKEGLLEVGGGCLNYNLSRFALQNNIKNFEFLVGIPGTIGGGVCMNAGAYGNEFKDILKYVHAVDHEGNEFKITINSESFSYRKNHLNLLHLNNTAKGGLIFTKAIFNVEKGDAEEISKKMRLINEKRSSTQPITEKTGGSTFANPSGALKAWELVDKIGFRGKSHRGARMSEKHCNFMINDGTATASDMEELGDSIIEKVKSETGVELKWEIKIIGKK